MGSIGCGIVIASICVWLSIRDTLKTDSAVVDGAAEVKGKPGSIIEFIGGTSQTLGDIKKNERRRHVFVIRNKSATESVTLKSVKSSCGCLLVDKSYPRIIEPGGNCDIAVEIIGKRGTRPINDKYSLVALFDEVEPVQLRFGYKVIEDVAVYPEEVLHGEVYQKDQLAGSILLRPLDGQVLLVEKSSSEKGLIQVERCSPEHGGIRCYYTIASTLPGTYEDVLELSTNATIDAIVRIPFKWEVVPNVTVVPKSMFWNGIDRNGGMKEFVVKSVDDNTFQVMGIDYDKGKITIEALTESGERVKEARYRIKVNLNAFGGTQFFRQEVVLHTDRGDVVLAVFGNTLLALAKFGMAGLFAGLGVLVLTTVS
jgi:hypothetical protein